jgi:hypothetical protein
VNQARANYERQLAEYQQRLGDREFQVAQVKAKLQEVDNALPKALRSRPRPLQQLKRPIPVGFVGLSGLGRILMVVLVLRLLLWCPVNAQETLPCLDSSKECVEQLTELAIANTIFLYS